MKYHLIILLLFLSIQLFGQSVIIQMDTTYIDSITVNNIYIPKDIDDCISQLSRPDFSDYKSFLMSISEDSIGKYYRHIPEDLRGWFDFYKVTRLEQYFFNFGLLQKTFMINLIEHIYYRQLHNKPLNFEEEVSKYVKLELEFTKRFEKDSIEGVYIPRNIKECFLELDKLLNKNEIIKIKKLKKKSDTLQYHHGLGMWIRNNWGLWGGSRLQKYLMDRHLTEPDGMSSEILEFYWEWLNNKNDNWIIFDKNTAANII